ncbi:MAG: DUF2285 domain-containing protein [Phenylobacterium sp.]|uniref:DUF2285 domain-containing protein n=1 Tax=Phenylobacterium sp. TaxID=1871053 RepID=UPI001A5F0017|nr:DUF2285 domain-containing protein [Phenylobacterium sp.]MBL8772201.1 DUF2285 domain-containing protein [Phenylobacterium sp.]
MHGLLTAPKSQHRLWMPTPIPRGGAVACVVPLGASTVGDTSAVLQFWRFVSTGRATPLRFDARLKRAQASLWALDQHESGASYRTLAERLYGAARVASECWRTSSLRDSAIRLVRAGQAFVDGDYRRLLRRPPD